MCKIVFSRTRIRENRITLCVMTAVNCTYVRKRCEDKLNMWVFLCVQKRNGDYKLNKKYNKPLPSALRRTAKDASFIIYCSCAPANATWIACHCSSFRKV